MSQIDFKGLARDVLAVSDRVMERWLPEARLQGDEFVALNPTRVDRRPGSFQINRRSGKWHDFATGDGGSDLVSLVAYIDGVSQAEAAHRLQSLVGNAPRRQGASVDRLDRQAFARRVWDQCEPIEGTLAEQYLLSRTLARPYPADLRFHRACHHRQSDVKLPAMVAAVREVDGHFVGIHRTFLDNSGAKAQVSPPKMALGPIAGGAVRLGSHKPVLAISEGIETGLAAIQIRRGLSVWAALSTSGMRSLVVPADIRKICILADKDDPGLEAARALANRLTEEGRSVMIALPERGNDFADQLSASRTGGTDVG